MVKPLLVAVSLLACIPGGPARGETAGEYVCGTLLTDTTRYLLETLDPFTGLPYDQTRCTCRWESVGGLCQSAGVLPQLPDSDIIPFSQDPQTSAIDWQFTDDLATGEDPTLLYALEMRLHLTAGANEFGGLIWGATADISRYDRVRIRYRTSTPTVQFDLKLNSGLPGDIRERTVHLSGSPAGGGWAEATFRIADDFPQTDVAHLNYIVLASDLTLAGESEPVVWVDHLAFLADPARAADCSVVLDCQGQAGCFPDLVRFEPQTGAVNIAGAVAALTLLSQVGLVDTTEAKTRVGTILTSLAATPRVDGWIQDWHSPASLMPHPTNRISSMTDLPQLYAALMVVESTWPDLAADAAAVRVGMVDFPDLFEAFQDGPCPGRLHGSIDACAGLQNDLLGFYGNDTLLGEFLTLATGAVPPTFWTLCLPRQGCELHGEGDRQWYTTGAFACVDHEIPAVETGGPFLQLASILYLDASRLPIGNLSIAESAGHMLAAQRVWAAEQALAVWGWANHTDAGSCDYDTCDDFTSDQVTPYICAMGLGLDAAPAGTSCLDNLFELHALGADTPIDSGTVLHFFGSRDAWNQVTNTSREDAYLYPDQAWIALGLLNACHGELVRQTFAAHPVAQQGYDVLAGLTPPCSAGIFTDGFETGDVGSWSAEAP